MFWLSQVTRMFWVRAFQFSDTNIHRDVACTILRVPKHARKLERKKLFCVIQFLGTQKDAFLVWVKNSSAPRWLSEVQWSDSNTLECFPCFICAKHLMLSRELVTAATSSDPSYVSINTYINKRITTFPPPPQFQSSPAPIQRQLQTFPWGSSANNARLLLGELSVVVRSLI